MDIQLGRGGHPNRTFTLPKQFNAVLNQTPEKLQLQSVKYKHFKCVTKTRRIALCGERGERERGPPQAQRSATG